MNGTEMYLFNKNEQRVEVSNQSCFGFFLNRNLTTTYIDVYIKNTDDIYVRYL